MTGTDKVWSAINRDYGFVDRISKEGSFVITAPEIKKYKEPRLVTKFDSSEDIPQIFKDNNLSILSINRGSYIISDIETFKPIADITKKPVNIPVTNNLVTITLDTISSESQAINFAKSLGIIQSFVGEEVMFDTLDGRMGSGEFDFTINRHSGGTLPVSVRNAQIEIDKCLEGQNTIAIIEAKKDRIMPDFMERQLYYPYRMIRTLSGGQKEIKNLFFSYNNGIIDLREYRFEDYMNYNSMSLVKEERYFLSDSTTTITKDILFKTIMSTPVVDEITGIPFPQSNTFDRIVALCERLRIGDALPNDLIYIIGVTTSRQAYYYMDAAKYLGLVQMKDGFCSLTKKGKDIQKEMPYKRMLSYIMSILSHRPFRESFMIWMRENRIPDEEEVIRIMKNTPNIQVFGDNVYKRRSSTVRTWIKFIIQNID